MSNLDHIADFKAGGVELQRLSKLYDFPDFVKSASLETTLTLPAGTPTTACADPVNKRFWCHTKAACWLSHLFFTEKSAELHPKDRVKIKANLGKYADYYGIKTACDAILARHGALNKSAVANLQDSDYAYVWVDASGTKYREYPLRNAMEVKVAAEWLFEHKDRVDFLTRHTMSKRILEKAASYGAAIKPQQEFLEKQAGRGICEHKEVVAMVRNRAMLVPQDAYVTYDAEGKPQGGARAEFLKMAEIIEDSPKQVLQPDMMVKLAATIDTLDRQFGFVGKYSAGLPRPEDVLFKVTLTKAASELAAHVETTTGAVYEKAAFGKLSAGDVSALFGEDFLARVSTPLGRIDPEKMAEEVATLPRPDAQLLEGLLSDNGVVPAMKKAASAKQGIDQDLMAQLADLYRRSH